MGDPIEWDEDGKHNSFSFVQIEDQKGNKIENGVKGILPVILSELWTGRKATKKIMETTPDEFVYHLTMHK